MLSMPMSIPRLSITQAIIAEEEIEKEQDNTQKETDSVCLIGDESFKEVPNNETPRLLRRIPNQNDSDQNKQRASKADDANVLCDSMQISVPKHLDSPQISMTTVNNSDDEIIVRRGLERGESEINLGSWREDEIVCQSVDRKEVRASLNQKMNNFMVGSQQR